MKDSSSAELLMPKIIEITFAEIKMNRRIHESNGADKNTVYIIFTQNATGNNPDSGVIPYVSVIH